MVVPIFVPATELAEMFPLAYRVLEMVTPVDPHCTCEALAESVKERLP